MKQLALIIAQLLKLIIEELGKYRRKKEAINVQKEYDRAESDPYSELMLKYGGDSKKPDTKAPLDEERKADE